MKKPQIVIVSILGVVALAVAAAVIWDMTSRKQDAPKQVAVLDPLAPTPAPPQGQIANLQAPVPQAGNAEIARLIAQLGDDSWDKRHEATEALKKIGKPAVPQLELAVNDRNNEISTRSKAILRFINGNAEAAVAQPNAGGNPAGAAGGMDLGALMNNPQVQQMMQNPQMMDMARQMMAGQGGQGGAGGMDLGALMQNPQIQQMMQGMMGGQGGAQGGAGGMDLGALMNNPQVQQMIQNPQFMQMVMQMMAGQGGRGGQGGAGNLGGMLGGAQQGARGGRGQLGGGQMGGGNLGAMMQNPQIQQMLQQLLANGGGLGGARQGGLARNAPAPPPAAAMSTDLTATFGVRVGDANGGVRVVDVKANTPAANAGLKTGDLIVAVNGRQVASGDELKDALTASGATVKLDVQRRGDVITLSAKK